jgi:hypothetical protein
MKKEPKRFEEFKKSRSCGILKRDIDEIASKNNSPTVQIGDFMREGEELVSENYTFLKDPEKYQKLKDEGIIGGYGSPDVDLIIVDNESNEAIGALGFRKYAEEVRLTTITPYPFRTDIEVREHSKEDQETILLDYLHLGEKYRHKGHGRRILSEFLDLICDCSFETLKPILPNYEMERAIRKEGYDYDEKKAQYKKTCEMRDLKKQDKEKGSCE